MRNTHPDDIFLWSDGTNCTRREHHEMNHMSDDFIVLYTDTIAWENFDPENPLRTLQEWGHE